MDLQRNSQEYAHINFSPVLGVGDVIEASVDLLTWHPVDIGLDGVGTILLRGPDSLATLGLQVPGRTELWVRITSTPEIIVRSAGWIVVYQ